MRAFFAVLGLISLVSAHGYVQQVTANGVVYPGWNPNVDPYLSPTPSRVIRKVPGNGPVQDLSLIDVQCNGYTDGGVVGSSPAALTATIAAGSSLTVNWTTWPDSHLGPIVTYLARAPSDITAWSPGSSAVWFKVAQSGYSNGVWASTTLIKNNGIYSFTIPSSLKAGQYIVRHENIALHAAYTYPGVQIYPSCIQITVTGSGSATGPSSLVSFPGAYTASTPGIVFDVYQGNSSTYVIPGPAVMYITTIEFYSIILSLAVKFDPPSDLESRAECMMANRWFEVSPALSLLMPSTECISRCRSAYGAQRCRGLLSSVSSET